MCLKSNEIVAVLTKTKNTMNKLLIFFNIQKNIQTEAVFTKTEMNNEQIINFLENISMFKNISNLKFYLLRKK